MIPRKMLYHPGDRRGRGREFMRRNLRGGVILCNPGDNSPPRLKCQKIPPVCGFLWEVWFIMWVWFLRVRMYLYEKGSAWVPAFAGTHASGRAGQHFDLFDSLFDTE